MSDKKLGVDNNSDGVIDYYNADVITATDYYPFGMQMPGRKYSQPNTKYRYGFNGKENDNEIKGEGNQQDYGMRIYDPRLGRFLSVDPLTNDFPWWTPYQFAGNTPVNTIDLDGMEVPPVNNKNQNEVQHKEASKMGITVQQYQGLLNAANYSPSWMKISQQKLTPKLKTISANQISSNARKILDRAYDREGRTAEDRGATNDPGRLTKFGIAKTREWPQAAKILGIGATDENLKNLSQSQADQYYVASRITPYSLNDIADIKLAYALFDQSVLTPGIVNSNLKSALNDVAGSNIAINNKPLNSKELSILNATDAGMVINKFIEKQDDYFSNSKNINEKTRKANLNGWRNRLDSLKTFKPEK